MKLRVRRQEEINLNLTSLIDVVLLLLIFFMVSTTFTQSSALNIELPEATQSQTKDQTNTLEIGIDAKGFFYLEGRPLQSSDKVVLKRELAKLIAAGAQSKVTILGDQNAPHHAVVSAMDVAGQLGITQLRILAKIG